MFRQSTELCPCGSNTLYSRCCQMYHTGCMPESALVLMRSRYSAYAKNLAEYIIATTHPKNSSVQADRLAWSQEILLFTQSTSFRRLEIIAVSESERVATVTFAAYLQQGNNDRSFAEISTFQKEAGRWLYLKGDAVLLQQEQQ